MPQDAKLQSAASRILQRSERQPDLENLLATFVDVGIIPQLDNTEGLNKDSESTRTIAPRSSLPRAFVAQTG